MNKLSIETLKALFDYLDSDPSLVIWIRNIDYQRQLYISPSYESIWGQKSEQLYDNPSSWNNFLYTDDRPGMLSNINNRKIQTQNLETHNLFRILDTNGKVKFIKDQFFMLVSEQKEPMGFGGISKMIPEAQWEFELHKKIHPEHFQAENQLKSHVFNILKNELRCSTTSPHAEAPIATTRQPITLKCEDALVDLTEREVECLSHLLKGKSAKLTASLMNISVRTVEFHLNNIKLKAKCRTKLELLSKISY